MLVFWGALLLGLVALPIVLVGARKLSDRLLPTLMIVGAYATAVVVIALASK